MKVFWTLLGTVFLTIGAALLLLSVTYLVMGHRLGGIGTVSGFVFLGLSVAAYRMNREPEKPTEWDKSDW